MVAEWKLEKDGSVPVEGRKGQCKLGNEAFKDGRQKEKSESVQAVIVEGCGPRQKSAEDWRYKRRDPKEEGGDVTHEG